MQKYYAKWKVERGVLHAALYIYKDRDPELYAHLGVVEVASKEIRRLALVGLLHENDLKLK
jgi:hypothetical protein